MSNKVQVLFIFLLHSIISNAQYHEDAFRFSQSSYHLGNTARIQAIGGAQIALGGDISSATNNPAGLGFFNNSVFVFTPSIDFINATTEYGIALEDRFETQGSEESFKNNFNVSNIGAVINFSKNPFTDDKFKGGSLAISLNRNNTYHANRTYQGKNIFNSYSDALAINSGLTPPDIFFNLDDIISYNQAAYRSYLISPSYDDNGNLRGYIADHDGFPSQRETIKQRGSHYQLNIAWGENYDDKVYFGAGIGVQVLNYKEIRDYEESDFTLNSSPDARLNAVYVDSEKTVKGKGVNINTGIIFRPLDFLAIGASYSSPRFMSFNENVFFDFEVDWNPKALYIENLDTVKLNEKEAVLNSSLFVNQYTLKTPSKLGVGIAIFFAKNGFLSTDLEFIDYSKIKINSDDFSSSDDNNVINRQYESVINVRAGGEYRFNNFRLRSGYSFSPDPVVNSSVGNISSISIGFGYRTFDYFIDFSIVSSKFQGKITPYSIDVSQSLDLLAQAQPVATSDFKNTTVSITFGLNL